MNLSTTGLRLSADAAIDLHLHTINSDGQWLPETLFDHLRREQFGLVAITDHDRPDTAAAIQRLAVEQHLPVLVGVEMSGAWKGELTDMLCFGFEPGPNALSALAEDVWLRQQENTRQVYAALQRQGYAFPPDALESLLAKPSSDQPQAFITLLRDLGYGLGEPSAGELVTEAECDFATNTPAAIVAAAHRSGGVCLLAHPGRSDGFVKYDVPLLDQFRQEAPIDGLEIYYPLHTPAQTAMYQEYAHHHHLLISAGSDSHRPNKPPIKYQAELCRALLERLGIEIE